MDLVELARIIAPDEAGAIFARHEARAREGGGDRPSAAGRAGPDRENENVEYTDRRDGPRDPAALATLLEAAYPALAPWLAARWADVAAVARAGLAERSYEALRALAADATRGAAALGDVRAALRRFAFREKLRIAARELLPQPGTDVDVTARELSDLASACTEEALREALAWADARFGEPVDAAGDRCAFVVVGMGKLGGRELNAGSDIDLLLFYATDDGGTRKGGALTDTTLHEYFARVTQRMTATLDEATEDGIVWRVDLRLRPEGSTGPLVNALAAAERYYESWGRTWERVALLRARPIAGDLAFGRRVLEALSPFVWRRTVDPRIAEEMSSLLLRARVEMAGPPERDVKLGPGGIREAEFFVQSLQLIWGGRDPALRSTNTLDALLRLRSGGLVTELEAREAEASYLTLRRLEHRIQTATGLQTHAIPADPALLLRIARSLGFASTAALMDDLLRTRAGVEERMASLTSSEARVAAERASRASIERLYAAIDAGDDARVLAWLPEQFGAWASPDLARHLTALARPPDAPLGSLTRDRHPELGVTLVEALAEAADPEQAARLLAALFARLAMPSVYARALAVDPRAVRRLTGLFGASAFLGQAAVAHPSLVDSLLFGRGTPDPEGAARAVRDEVQQASRDDADDFVGALRRAKRRVTMEVGLADLAGEIDVRGAALALSALAEATLAEATRFALAERGLDAGLAVIAMGKLGGREIGYGSDLDLFFVYADDALPDPDDAQERFIRVAQRVLRLLGSPHGAGPGYELDTRLRPSGNAGLLVVSLDAFRRYQETRAEPWERQALLKARFAAGDAALGEQVIAAASAAAYEAGAAPKELIHHLRMRMENELAGERLTGGRARFDPKLGRGGIVDVEFAVQWLQMRHGADRAVRTTETDAALSALERRGYVDRAIAATLRDGYRFLRQLEQRARVHHGGSSALLEEAAPGLALLARRMGMRDGPRGTASEALLAHYVAVTTEVRRAYLAVLGLSA